MNPTERMAALLYYANAAKVARGLTEKGYSVSPATVSRWANGKNVTPIAVQLVADLLGTTKEAAPDWERLMRTVDAIAERVGVSPDERTAIDAAYAAQSPLPADETPGHPEADDPAGAGRRDRRR